jgi:hypothetical protein
MSNAIPKYHEAFLPILKQLADGNEVHYEELKRQVRDHAYGHLPRSQKNNVIVGMRMNTTISKVTDDNKFTSQN